MYRVNNLLFVHTIFACIFGVKLKNFPGGYAPLTPIFSGGLHPPEPLALSFGKPLSKFLATPLVINIHELNALQKMNYAITAR